MAVYVDGGSGMAGGNFSYQEPAGKIMNIII